MKKLILLINLLTFGVILSYAQQPVSWEHISSKNGRIEAPNDGNQQTSAAVADFDNDGINDFVITERTQAPAISLYLRKKSGWKKLVVEKEALEIEAGTTACDVDGDGDGKTDLVFWAQGDNTLYFTRIPENPKELSAWKLIPAYTYYTDSQMEQVGKYPGWKGINEHEGLDKADIDGDGVQDIVGGGMWFKYIGNDRFSFNIIDEAYTFSRSAAGQVIKGGRPEVILVVGDGRAPLNLYEYQKGTWVKREILPLVENGHSLSLIDFNGDGNMDIWNAEMTLGGNTDAVNHILLGDGMGNFPDEILISKGIDLHESEIADLDGDGDLDILGKPYDGNAPRLDIWLQNGTGSRYDLNKKK